MKRALLSLGLCCAAAAHARASQPMVPLAGVPFEKAAREFMAQNGLSDKKPEQIEFESLLKERFLVVHLGAFEVHLPLAGLERHASEFKDCSFALLVAQEKLCDWGKPSGVDQKALRADLKTVSDWVKGWRVPALAKAGDSAGKDLTGVLGASETVVAASGRLAASLGKGEALGLAHESPVAIRMVLEPTRKEFVELACFLGAARPDERADYWAESLADWATCWVEDIQVIALEYAAPGHQPDDYVSGESMNERDPTVMQQQVVQFSVQRLFRQLIGEQLPEILVGGLSMNLVLDQFGEIGTRIDGDLRGRTAQARSMFIPGVGGDGFLPKNSAETRWREDRGRSRFVHVLRQSQKDGEGLDKTLKNHPAGFGVRSDSGGELAPVRAPFLIAEAEVAPGEEKGGPAAAFQGDYAELQRAYKCAFVAWLQTKAAGGEKPSREKFAELLKKLGESGATIEAAFPAVYENAPLTDPEAGKDSLEGKFLIWLSKQK